MNRRWHLIFFTLCGGIIIILDRITKLISANLWHEYPYTITSYLSLHTLINRGIVWGFLHDVQISQLFVVLMSSTIMSILVYYSWLRWKSACAIGGELLVIAGALSNLIDRWMYDGVVDFIVISYRGWSWPAFNIADISIVVGICIMIIEQVNEHAHSTTM